MINAKYRVDIIESEAGWGQRVDDTRDFDSKQEAETFVEKYNKVNNSPKTPSWYMYATQPYLVDVDTDRHLQ